MRRTDLLAAATPARVNEVNSYVTRREPIVYTVTDKNYTAGPVLILEKLQLLGLDNSTQPQTIFYSLVDVRGFKSQNEFERDIQKAKKHLQILPLSTRSEGDWHALVYKVLQTCQYIRE